MQRLRKCERRLIQRLLDLDRGHRWKHLLENWFLVLNCGTRYWQKKTQIGIHCFKFLGIHKQVRACLIRFQVWPHNDQQLPSEASSGISLFNNDAGARYSLRGLCWQYHRQKHTKPHTRTVQELILWAHVHDERARTKSDWWFDSWVIKLSALSARYKNCGRVSNNIYLHSMFSSSTTTVVGRVIV